MVMHPYSCSGMQQIRQELPNLVCNNQSMTSWKVAVGTWKIPKNKLSDFISTPILYKQIHTACKSIKPLAKAV